MWASTFVLHSIDCMSLHFYARHLLFLLIMLWIIRLYDMLSLFWYRSDSCNFSVWLTSLILSLESKNYLLADALLLSFDHAVKEYVLEAV